MSQRSIIQVKVDKQMCKENELDELEVMEQVNTMR